MRLKVLKTWVVVVCLGLLSGCSTLRLAYDNGPTLAWWWIDGYGDFSSEQATRVKDGIRSWFDWHRKTQLEAYAAWLAGPRAKIGESVTPAQVCTWYDEGRRLLDPAIERGLLAAAAWVPGLTEAQFRHLEQRYAKGNDEVRRDFLQPDAADRREAAMRRALDRAESLYGRLDAAQRRLVADGVEASPFDPEAWLAERQRRQRDTLQTLRRLVAEKPDAERTTAVLRQLAQRTERSVDPAHRAYQQRLREHNCAFAARLHNATTAAQRQTARERLQGWQDDLRALAAPASTPAALSP